MNTLRTVLVTGGAGFIGTHLVPEIARVCRRVVIVDNLLEQVHGADASVGPWPGGQIEFVRGDIRDRTLWDSVATRFPDVEVVVHLAALTGTGQSMTDAGEYVDVNCQGTATMLSQLASGRFPALRHFVQASSRAVYGEGTYRCPVEGAECHPGPRGEEQCRLGQWSPTCAACGAELVPVPTAETAALCPSSVYGVSKLAQEGLASAMLGTHVPVTVLRFQNVYGPGQSLLNPYTGVLGVFHSRILHGQPIELFEDGRITRDFVYCSDVVAAFRASLERRVPGVFNVGGGEFIPVERVARLLCRLLGRDVSVRITGKFRVGDIRHGAADLTRARAALGFTPAVGLEEGLARYVAWARERVPMSLETAARSRHSLRAESSDP